MTSKEKIRDIKSVINEFYHNEKCEGRLTEGARKSWLLFQEYCDDILQDLERLEVLEKEIQELKELQELNKQGLWNLKQENEKLKNENEQIKQWVINKISYLENGVFLTEHKYIKGAIIILKQLLKEVLG